MQLSNIKKSSVAKQDKDPKIDHGGLGRTTQTTTTATNASPGQANPTSIMSMTNILIKTKSSTRTDHLELPQRAHSFTNLPQTNPTAFKDNSRLYFNVCGETFEVLESTVQRYPNTFLADSVRREKFWDEERNEYYLDRNRACFESVLTYYQSNGILIRPQNIPDLLFIRELQFYDLGEEVLQKVRGDEEKPKDNVEQPEKKKPTATSTLQRKVWDLFEYPETSTAARAMAWFSCTIVLLSIIMFCIETLPEFQKKDESGETKDYHTFFIIETFCIGWFTFEYLTRLISSPNKWRFVKEALNIIDLIAILPYFLNFALSGKDSNVSSVAILRAVRLVRVFRVFKLSRYSSGLRILGLTLRASLGELGLLVFFLTVGVVLFASAIYYAEMNSDNNSFKSIPHAFWWAIVTMTTVGYGDMYPTTLIGKCVGSVCACTGILAIALPVPVIVANFERFYSKSQEEAKRGSPDSNKKLAKYKALKKFFDKLRHRDSTQTGGNLREEDYYDMGGEVAEEVHVRSEGDEHRYSLLEKPNDSVSRASSV